MILLIDLKKIKKKSSVDYKYICIKKDCFDIYYDIFKLFNFKKKEIY